MWDPAQYGRYADERGRPFHELLARVDARRPARVVDLGCGDGALTATLAERWPERDRAGGGLLRVDAGRGGRPRRRRG